jgi:hypothetical protein
LIRRAVKKVALALAAGGVTVALLAIFALPVMKTNWLGKCSSETPGFVRIWKLEREPIYALGLAGEIAVGLFVVVVSAAFGHRRDAARRSE